MKGIIRWLKTAVLYGIDTFDENWGWGFYGDLHAEAMGGDLSPEGFIVKSRCILWYRLYDAAKFAFWSFFCIWGHRWYVDSSAGPESGSEDFYCVRCGESHHIIYY